MQIINLVGSERIKTFHKYKTKDVRPGTILTIELKRKFPAKSYGETIEVIRVDPKKTGKIIGKLIHYGFLNRKTDEYKEVLFHESQIEKIYKK